ncbi:MAG: hypothetical protein U0166_01750 [Acidobacteriota bacterium]
MKRLVLFASVLCAALPAMAAIVPADPSTYQGLLSTLQPGDTMVLAGGTYPNGLTISNMNGQPGLPIAITGPGSGTPATFTGRSCCNTVSISDSSYVEIKNLRLDGQNLAVDGVKAEGSASFAHHITIQGLTIVNHGNNQQIVGISTKCNAWDWIIRGNVIIGAGTGLYLGDSTGLAPFVEGLVEDNFVQDTIGYNMQIKHQLSRPAGMPQNAKTVIRHNVFSKANNGSTGGNARPNLLVGHFPPSGTGSNDYYEIYGNFFHQNPTESLFQGEGNIAFYDNLMVNDNGPAVRIQPQNDVPKLIRIFNNTIVASQGGINITGGDPGYTQEAIGNGAFAAPPINGGTQRDNITDTYGNAGTYLSNPFAPPGTLDLYPRVGTMSGPPISPTGINTFENWNVDFNGKLHGGTFRGAYDGEGTNPGWLPQLGKEPYGAETFVVGQGFGPANLNRVRAFDAAGAPAPVDFLAYAAGTFGTNVTTGNTDGGSYEEILTGPGPGPVFGPQVRGFDRTGSAIAKINYYAYGTLKYGVNVASGSLDADAFHEILTGPGPGAVFGPHVRGWNVDGGSATAIAKISFFAYGTLKFGVNVADGDVDRDGFTEILTGPGPGQIFGPQVRGFNFDGSAVTPISKINFNAFGTPQFGCNLDGGDVDRDGWAEIAASPGPSILLPAQFAGFDYDGSAIAALPGFLVTPFTTMFGGRTGLGTVDEGAEGRDELLAAAGPDPAATSTVVPYTYLNGTMSVSAYTFTPYTGGYGVNESSGTIGY